MPARRRSPVAVASSSIAAASSSIAVAPLLAAASFVAAGLVAGPAFAQLRIVNYNLLDKPTSTTNANVSAVFAAIASDSVNGIARRPDLIICQEQTSTSAANLATILNATFGVTTYTSSTPSAGSQPTDKQAFVWNSATIGLAPGTSPLWVPVTGYRGVIRADFRIAGYTGAESTLTAVGAHLMATDPTGRAAQTSQMRAIGDLLPAGSPIVYAGDFNVGSSTEQSYQNLISGTATGKAYDPINLPGTWNNNSSVARWHTQSTRLVAESDGGATGGVDDRFDFQLVSSTVMDAEGLSYLGPTVPGTTSTHSYRSFGNIGQVFNKALNDASNTAQPPAVLNALYAVSDHIPVVVDYQIPGKLAASVTGVPARVIQNGSASASVAVSNVAPVTVSVGADELEYAVSLTGNVTGTASGTARALVANPAHSFALDTSVLGTRSFTVAVSTASQGAQDASQSFPQSYSVIRGSAPSFATSSTTTTKTIDFGIVALGLPLPGAQAYSIANLALGGDQAALDVDSITTSGASSAFSTTLATSSNLTAGFARNFSASFIASQIGTYSAGYSIATSDEDLPGAQSRSTLTLTLLARIALGGDANLDGSVNFDDLLALAANYNSAGPTAWATGDFNRSGTTDFDDLLLLAANYNTSVPAGAWAFSQSSVPEPSAIFVATLAGALTLTRRRR